MLLWLLLLMSSARALSPSGFRSIVRVEQAPRLPVWPVVGGLVATALDLAKMKGAAAAVEENVGGRVAPMSLSQEEADPFILLVHHRHAFLPFDPIRPLFRLLLPERFPAHPHRGFETVTMTLKGGLKHRDSMGIKQEYADGDVQWLTAGSGMLHEEMWLGEQCELYQLWLNLPKSAKMAKPSAIVLKNEDHPIRKHGHDSREIRLDRSEEHDESVDAYPYVSKDYSPLDDEAATYLKTGPTRDDVRVSIIQLDKENSNFTTSVPADATVLIYCRKGQVKVGDDPLDQYCLAYTERGTSNLKLTATKPNSEVLFLCGLPLREPVAASGTWVVSNQAELVRADADYKAGRLGVPWDHELSDTDWQKWVQDYAPKNF